MTRDGYVAQWAGVEYEAHPDGDSVRLYSNRPAEGFDEIEPGRYRRIVPAADTEQAYVRTRCRWRGEPFVVIGENPDWLRLEYTGGKAPVAASLGLEEFEYGVYQGWASRAEVTDLQEIRV